MGLCDLALKVNLAILCQERCQLPTVKTDKLQNLQLTFISTELHKAMVTTAINALDNGVICA